MKMSDKGVDSLLNQNNTPEAAVLFLYIYTGKQLAVGSIPQCTVVGGPGRIEF